MSDDGYEEEPDARNSLVEMYAELFYRSEPRLDLESIFASWGRWGYACALSDAPRESGQLIFKGGAAVILGDANVVDHAEVPEHYASFAEIAKPLGNYCLDHAAALDAFRESSFVLPVTVRVLTKNPFAVANELLISLDGLFETTSPTCVWLDHLRCLVTATEFREFADLLRIEEEGERAIPAALFFTPHIYRLQPDLDAATGGLAHFGHPELALRGRLDLSPEQVARILFNLGNYVLNGTHLEPGHSVTVAGMNFTLQEFPSDEDSPATLDLVPASG